MNKKISFPIALIIIVVCAVFTGVIVAWQYGLIPEIGPSGPLPRPSEKEVTITTDKKEYEQGGEIKIKVKNSLDKSIWYLDVELGGWNPWWGLQKLEEGNWVEVKVHKPIDGECLIIVREQVPIEELIKELKTNVERGDTWILENCVEVSPIGPEIKLKPLALGTYRFFFKYGLSKDNYTKKTIYSNEFTIKEKETNIPKEVLNQKLEDMKKNSFWKEYTLPIDSVIQGTNWRLSNEREAKEIVENFIINNKESLKINLDDLELIQLFISTYEKKLDAVVFYSQKYKGLLIFEGRIRFVLNQNGVIYTIKDGTDKEITTNITPEINLNEAIKMIKEYYNEDQLLYIDDKEPSLIIYKDKLAWYFNLQFPIGKEVILDAQNGEILLERNNWVE